MMSVERNSNKFNLIDRNFKHILNKHTAIISLSLFFPRKKYEKRAIVAFSHFSPLENPRQNFDNRIYGVCFLFFFCPMRRLLVDNAITSNLVSPCVCACVRPCKSNNKQGGLCKKMRFKAHKSFTRGAIILDLTYLIRITFTGYITDIKYLILLLVLMLLFLLLLLLLLAFFFFFFSCSSLSFNVPIKSDVYDKLVSKRRPTDVTLSSYR